MMTTALFVVLVGSLALAVLTETAVAANHRDAAHALYAAEAAVEFVLQEIALVEDWTEVLAAPGNRRLSTESLAASGKPGQQTSICRRRRST